ncbi:MinD/ParA family ATP-binding protein [Pseudonocardia humida]|uniref:MinD/ParA family protein n=1 Tax=Pseudonocardia humida TaxID=2800819 RepID=A0ABT0ZUD4_9PSEU|nr:MinD/ParA family protein [Pseudonocardia humida]MCO1654340.1 MinD/ParA family protein [Pseudonocardia humida]
MGGPVVPKRSFAPNGDDEPASAPPVAPRLPVRAVPPADAVVPARGSASDLTDRSIVTHRERAPRSGWRRLLHRISGGAVRVADTPAEPARREREARIRRPLAAPHHIAVVSLKGGVGKTTVTAAVGLVLAELRGDRVAVLDADPDGGTLADRLSGESTVSVRDLAARAERIRALPELARFTSLSGRLQVLASDQDPRRHDALDRAGYEAAHATLSRFCDIVVTDSGTGMVHPVVGGTLDAAASVVVVGSLTVDGASRAGRTLDWLDAHGYGELAARAVVVLSADRSSPDVDAAHLREHFARRSRAVVVLPRDPHLAAGDRIRLAALRPDTRAAVLEVAALLADEFDSVPPSRASGGLLSDRTSGGVEFGG